MGKADFYPTPKSLTWELLNTGALNNCRKILEPACGNYAITNELIKAGFDIVSKDLIYNNDFLKDNYSYDSYDAIVTNPPFSLFDNFVLKSKQVSSKVVMISKTNFFAAYQRNLNGIWANLENAFIFNRQVDYRSEFRNDGKFKCGSNLCTSWFVWNRNPDWNNNYWKTSIIDVNKYVLRK